jgi:hypothetical protein
METHVYTAKERREIKESMTPAQREYVETLEFVAIAAEGLMAASDETTRKRVNLAKSLAPVNFMLQ